MALPLAGCAAPDLGPKPLPRAPETVAAVRSLGGQPDGQWPGEGWWSAYGDPQLERLIDEAMRGSPDVAAAAARFRRAAGVAREAGAATLPSLGAQAGVSLDKQSMNNGFPPQFTALMPQGWNDNAQLAANLGFDIDLWGRNRAALAAATSEAEAARIDVRQARLALATGLSLAYFDLARLSDERDIRQAELDVRLASQRLVSQRQANGLETRGSVRQADAQVASARAGLAAADQALAVRRNQIAALLGAGPDRGLDIVRPALAPTAQRGLPDDVTTELVARRPDIAAARLRVEAASSRIAVAKADYFPAIRLGAMFGVQSFGIGNLFEDRSSFGSVGPAISLPLFRGGALEGRFRGARATYDEAVAMYDRTVIGAYQQVADAVTAQRLLAGQLEQARAARAASEEAYAIQRARYEGGLSTYLDVLQVEDRLLQARRAVIALEAAVRNADIDLIRALGGGFGTAGQTSEENPNG